MKFFACQKLMEIKTKIHLSLAINVIPFQIFVSKRSSLTYLKKIFTIYTYFGQARNQNKKLPVQGDEVHMATASWKSTHTHTQQNNRLSSALGCQKVNKNKCLLAIA